VAPALPATPSGEEALPSQDYIIGSEDSVEVQVWKNPDLSRTVTVRPDGNISLPLLHDIPAAGLTPEALRQQVAELALAGASKILRREVDAKVHADLLASIKAEL